MTQYARPDGDISAGNWTPSTGSTLYGTIDEVTPSDTDYDQSANNPADDTFECSLSSVTDPASSINHALKCRFLGQGTGTFNFLLIQGTTTIATYGVTSWPGTPTTYTINLSTGETDNITDYTDLRIRVVGNKTSGGLANLKCSWAEFSCPDAGASPITINLDAAAITAAGQVITITPAAASVSLDAAAITANGQVISVVPGAASVSLDPGNVTASGQVISVVPGAASVSLDPGNVTAAGQVISIVPGAASVSLSVGSVTAAGQVISISLSTPNPADPNTFDFWITARIPFFVSTPKSNSTGDFNRWITDRQPFDVYTESAGVSPITINLDAAAITATGQSISIVPGAASISLGVGNVTAAGQVLSVVPGAASVSLGVGNVSAVGQVISIVPGAVSVSLGVGNVTAAGQVITIVLGGAPITINLDAANVTAAGQSISIVPGSASVSLGVGNVTAAGQVLSVVPGAASVSLGVGNVSAVGQVISIVPGAVSVSLGVGNVLASGQTITIQIPVTIDLSVATVTVTAPAISIEIYPDRVLEGEEGYGSRVFVVDGLGAGNYLTIQEAIDQAQAQTPAAGSRWLIMVAPGEYQESLTLYDYVDVSGYSFGYPVNLVSPSNQAAINNFAECTISNINISGINDPLIKSGTFSASMRFVNCSSSIDLDELTLIQITSGALELYGCRFLASGRNIYMLGGSVSLFGSILTRDGAETGYPIETNGAVTLEALFSDFINIGAGGGSAIHIHTTNPTSIVLHHSLLRKSSGSESISTTITPTIYAAACVANAALDAAILGTQDVQVDSNY